MHHASVLKTLIICLPNQNRDMFVLQQASVQKHIMSVSRQKHDTSTHHASVHKTSLILLPEQNHDI